MRGWVCALTTGDFGAGVFAAVGFAAATGFAAAVVFAAVTLGFAAATVEMVRVGVGGAGVGGAGAGGAGAGVGAVAMGITFVVVVGVIEAVGAVGVDAPEVAGTVTGGTEARGAEASEVGGAETGGTGDVDADGAATGGVETEDGAAEVCALGAVGLGRGAAGGFGGSFFATYNCAARVATRRKRTKRKTRPTPTARASSEKKPHTTSPANPRTPAPMSYIPGMSGLCMVTPLARRQRATAPLLSPPQ
mgnify:CR=1 FL=1